MHTFPLATSHARLEGSGSVPSRALWELSVFFMKVWIPGRAVEKKHQDCKATYQISWLLITRGALVPPRVNGKGSMVRCKRNPQCLW